MSAVGGCSTPFLVHTVNELQNVVLMSFGTSLNHLPGGVEVGSIEGQAPKTSSLDNLSTCKSAASSSSHACGQCQTLPLVHEWSIPSGVGAAAALPNCLPECKTVPSIGEVAPSFCSCKSAVSLASFQVGVCKPSPVVQDIDPPDYCKSEASPSLPCVSHELVYVTAFDDSTVISQIYPKLLSRDSLKVMCPKSAGDNLSIGLHIAHRCEVLVAAPLLEKLGAGVQNPAHFHPNFVVPFVTCCICCLSPLQLRNTLHCHTLLTCFLICLALLG
jgi:hypothetical protein